MIMLIRLRFLTRKKTHRCLDGERIRRGQPSKRTRRPCQPLVQSMFFLSKGEGISPVFVRTGADFRRRELGLAQVSDSLAMGAASGVRHCTHARHFVRVLAAPQTPWQHMFRMHIRPYGQRYRRLPRMWSADCSAWSIDNHRRVARPEWAIQTRSFIAK